MRQHNDGTKFHFTGRVSFWLDNNQRSVIAGKSQIRNRIQSAYDDLKIHSLIIARGCFLNLKAEVAFCTCVIFSDSLMSLSYMPAFIYEAYVSFFLPNSSGHSLKPVKFMAWIRTTVFNNLFWV